jgi:hypothetical protein
MFTPRVDGTVPIQSSAPQFVSAFRERVAAGLLMGRPHPRSNYQVVDADSSWVHVRAANSWTAISVGLNDLELRLSSTGAVQFRVEFRRWAAYAVGFSGLLGLIGLILLFTLDVRSYIAEHASARVPGLSVDQNLAIAWVMVLFWGFAWPWLLIALYKRPLRRLVERLVREVDAQATSGRV